MEDTIFKGDFIFVSKMHYGSRMPITILQLPVFDFYSTDIQIPYFRVRGVSNIRTGDIMAFNFPSHNSKPIDLGEVFVKRCMGLPGDTLMSHTGYVYINSEFADSLDMVRRVYKLKSSQSLLGLETPSGRVVSRFFDDANNDFMYIIEASKNEIQELVKQQETKSIYVIPEIYDRTDGEAAFLSKSNQAWQHTTFGPLVIPKKNVKVKLDSSNVHLYFDIIKMHESNNNVVLLENKLYINNALCESYVFKQDYFFVLGDNRPSSRDSRNWGFVPMTHVIGKVIATL